MRLPVPREQLVKVKWYDSWSDLSRVWERKDEIEIDQDPITSVGYFVAASNLFIALAGAMSEEEYAGVQRIPRAAILSFAELKS